MSDYDSVEIVNSLKNIKIDDIPYAPNLIKTLMVDAAEEIVRLQAALTDISDPEKLTSHGDPRVLRDYAREALSK